MSILKQTKNNLPFFGKYIPKIQRQQRFIVIFVVFIICEIIKSIFFFSFKLSIFHCISFVSIVLSGWLLGINGPIFVGLLSNYFMGIFWFIGCEASPDPPFQLFTICMIIVGTGIGLLADIIRKSRFSKKDLSKEEQDQFYDELPLWGKYLSPKKRKQRLILFGSIFFVYLIIQPILFLNIRRGIIFSLNIIPIALSGWLLGIYGPIITALVTDFFLVLIVNTTGFLNEDKLIGIFQTLVTVLIGCVIGKLSELIAKSRITEEEIKKSKEEAERANRAKSEFLACMSHEIRTPINSIMGFAQILKEDLDESRHKERIDIILKSGKTLLTLINDILDLSKIEAGEMDIVTEEFSPRCILIPLHNIFSFKAKEKKLEFTISIDNSVPEILLGDEHRIQQIVSNLIHNAVKFTNKGSIKVTVEYIKKPGPQFIIRVHDTGIGIPRELHDAIFTVFKRGDPSLTRIYSGTGLGLAITKKLAEQMGGGIAVKSTPGLGSLFTVNLPLKAVENKNKNNKPYNNHLYPYTAETVCTYINNGITCSVLVAEDDESNRIYIHELLKRGGIYCDFARDGQETINKLERMSSENKLYDILILDIQMPILSGLDVITYIRKSDTLKNLYCVAVTAHALKGDEKKYLDAGCDAYIAKPIESHVLYKYVIKQLEEKSNNYKETSGFNKKSKEISLYAEKIKPIAFDKKDGIENIINKLRNNCKIYNRQELFEIQKECQMILPKKLSKYVESKIQTSIKSYDDEILLEIIEILAALHYDKPTRISSFSDPG